MEREADHGEERDFTGYSCGWIGEKFTLSDLTGIVDSSYIFTDGMTPVGTIALNVTE